MYSIRNNSISISVNPVGAELSSLKNEKNGLNYLWKGDPQFWAKHSPVLFPIVGMLKQGKYSFKGNWYQLPRHGFAREATFTLVSQKEDELVFQLTSSEQTKKWYPFDFSLKLKYQLQHSKMTLTYEVENLGPEPMFFSLGAHPAFAVPLIEGTSYEDYDLIFEEVENSDRWLIADDGIIDKTSVPCLNNTTVLHLKKELFAKDALVFKDLKSHRISLKSDKTPHGWHFDFDDFPFMGIWAAKNAPFVCIEPWCGIADSVLHNQDFESKEGIMKLEAGNHWTRNWSVSIF